MLEGKGYKKEGEKREKKWDNCNSIVNKIYLKKHKTTVRYHHFTPTGMAKIKKGKCW